MSSAYIKRFLNWKLIFLVIQILNIFDNLNLKI